MTMFSNISGCNVLNTVNARKQEAKELRTGHVMQIYMKGATQGNLEKAD